jgi:hypothetical protein
MDNFLVFESSDGNSKWYAKTETGEFAFSDRQGLYEWRRRSDGEGLYRIQYTGGDTQASDKNGRWTMHAAPEPNILGLRSAVARYKYGVN